MKVLFEELAAPQRAGGIEAACVGLAAQLSGLGHELVRHDASQPLPEGWRPDVVHVHGIWSPALMARWRQWQSAGVPCLVTVHGMLEPWALAHKKWKKRVAWLGYQKRMLQSATCIQATSEREARNLKKLGLKVPVAMIPWGIEVGAGEEDRGQESGVRSQDKEDSGGQEDDCSGASMTVTNVPSSELRTEEKRYDNRFSYTETPAAQQNGNTETPTHRTALFVGRIYPVKGLPMLVGAWAKLRPAGWKMKIVGPDEAGHLAEVEGLIQQAGLAGVFEFAGPLEGTALEQEYQNADLYIQPSHTENFGMAIAEALSHRLPVITTHGAPWKLLEEERCGWWVSISVEGIAGALDDATRKSPEELAAMGARGRTVVAERFAWERIAGEFLECYRWILGGGPKPRCVRG